MTFISMPSLSRLLKTLEVRELVTRERLAGDLRGSEFDLTTEGHAIVQKIAPHSEATYAEIECLMGRAEVEELYRVLEQIVERLGSPSDLELD